MKIYSINILNNKKIRVFNAKLDGKNLIVAGDPGTGKTTAITGLWNILSKGADQITHGEKKGSISMTLSDGSKTLICSRVYTKSSSTINIVDSNGEKLTTKDVDAMLSDLAVNPHKIAEMKPKERVDTLLKSAGIDKELEELEKAIADAEQDRLYQYRAKDKLTPGDEPEKANRINASDIIVKIEKAQAHNKEIEDANDKYQALKDRKAGHDEDITRMEKEIKRMEDEIEKLRQEIKTSNATIVNIDDGMQKIRKEYADKELEDVDSLKAELDGIEEANQAADRYREWDRRNTEYQEAVEKHKIADQAVKDLQDKKKALLDDVKFPLEGLTIQDGDLYYKECLFENLGTSEQMLVCAALAKEQVGEIRVVRMDGIEAMGKADFEKMKKLFNDADIQILASRVSRGDVEPDEVTIEEGIYKEGESDE